MKEEIKRAIAFSVLNQISNLNSGALYDYQNSQHNHMTSNYDYTSGSHYQRSGNQMYHYGVGNHIQLKINGNKFSGYDYDSGSHFQGSINGKQIQIFDYSTGTYNNYSA